MSRGQDGSAKPVAGMLNFCKRTRKIMEMVVTTINNEDTVTTTTTMATIPQVTEKKPRSGSVLNLCLVDKKLKAEFDLTEPKLPHLLTFKSTLFLVHYMLLLNLTKVVWLNEEYATCVWLLNIKYPYL